MQELTLEADPIRGWSTRVRQSGKAGGAMHTPASELHAYAEDHI
jgi:hypothetical protein